eukprot:gene24790-10432_t
MGDSSSQLVAANILATRAQLGSEGHSSSSTVAHPRNWMQYVCIGMICRVERWFRSIDTDNSGFLDPEELQRALAMGSLNYPLTVVDAMIRAFDQKDSRSLNMTEFSKLHEFLTSVTASFNFYDRDHSSTLEIAEVVQALAQAGFTLDPPVLQKMMKKYDLSNTRCLQKYDLSNSSNLKSCARTFGAFDPHRTGSVTLKFNEFVYASSHIS